MAIVKYTWEQLKNMPTQTDLKRVRAMKDEDIDFSDCPDITDLIKQGKAKLVYVSPGRPKQAVCKKNISIRLPANDLIALRLSGKGWQTRVSNLISDSIKNGLL